MKDHCIILIQLGIIRRDGVYSMKSIIRIMCIICDFLYIFICKESIFQNENNICSE